MSYWPEILWRNPDVCLYVNKKLFVTTKLLSSLIIFSFKFRVSEACSKTIGKKKHDFDQSLMFCSDFIFRDISYVILYPFDFLCEELVITIYISNLSRKPQLISCGDMTDIAIFNCLKSENHLKSVCLQIHPAPSLRQFNVYFPFVVSQSLCAPEIVVILSFS